MSHPSKVKGSRYELDLRDDTRAAGFPAVERCYGAGRTDDTGDLCGLPDFAVEAKNHREHRFAEWVDEAERERLNAGKRYGVVAVKRRGKPAADSFAVMPWHQLLEIEHELIRLRGMDGAFRHAQQQIAALNDPMAGVDVEASL